LRLRHDLALVTTAQVSAACFDLPSHLVMVGGVLCWMRLFLFKVCLCGGVHFGVLCTIATSFYYDTVILLFIFSKIAIRAVHATAPQLAHRRHNTSASRAALFSLFVLFFLFRVVE
jgi:hypothetical protein